MPLPAALALLAVLSFAPKADASLVFSNLGPGDTFGASGVIFQSGPGGGIPDIDLANSFTPSGTFTLDEIEIPMRSNGPGQPAIAIDIWLMADAGGVPGAILETVPILGVTVSALYSGLSTTHSTLTAGTPYWIGASVNEPPSPGSPAVWHFVLVNDGGSTASRFDGAARIAQTSSFRGAFRVSGTAPEPSALLLVGVAASLGGVFARRRSAESPRTPAPHG